MISLVMLTAIIVVFYTDEKEKESTCYCVPIGFSVAMFVMSALAINGKYLVFDGIPYTVALLNLVSIAVLLCLIVIFVIIASLMCCCVSLFVCCCPPTCTPFLKLIAFWGGKVSNDDQEAPVAPVANVTSATIV
jgi:hypothetical protein